MLKRIMSATVLFMLLVLGQKAEAKAEEPFTTFQCKYTKCTRNTCKNTAIADKCKAECNENDIEHCLAVSRGETITPGVFEQAASSLAQGVGVVAQNAGQAVVANIGQHLTDASTGVKAMAAFGKQKDMLDTENLTINALGLDPDELPYFNADPTTRSFSLIADRTKRDDMRRNCEHGCTKLTCTVGDPEDPGSAPDVRKGCEFACPSSYALACTGTLQGAQVVGPMTKLQWKMAMREAHASVKNSHRALKIAQKQLKQANHMLIKAQRTGNQSAIVTATQQIANANAALQAATAQISVAQQHYLAVKNVQITG